MRRMRKYFEFLNDTLSQPLSHYTYGATEKKLHEIFYNLTARPKLVFLREEEFTLPLYCWAFVYEYGFCLHYDGVFLVERCERQILELETLAMRKHKWFFYEFENFHFFSFRKLNFYLEGNFEKHSKTYGFWEAVRKLLPNDPRPLAIEVVKNLAPVAKFLIPQGFRVLTIRVGEKENSEDEA